MKNSFCTKFMARVFLIIFVIIAIAACYGPMQKIRVNTSPEMEEAASLSINLNKDGKFYFTDVNGNPATDTISFNELISQNRKKWEKEKGTSGNKDWDFKKIQSIEVYRGSGCFDFAICIDNVCSCRRYNNYGSYCCACNCDCRP